MRGWLSKLGQLLKQSASKETLEKELKPHPRLSVLQSLRRVKRSQWLLLSAGTLVVAVIVGFGVVPRPLPGDLISRALNPTLHSDGDGLLDLIEIDGWTANYGRVNVADPNDADTDGEKPGEHISSQRENDVFARISDPVIADSGPSFGMSLQ